MFDEAFSSAYALPARVISKESDSFGGGAGKGFGSGARLEAGRKRSNPKR